ncbi:MAG: mRNA surveillance protein pelota [Candidatus Micrarchaeia archaeon]
MRILGFNESTNTLRLLPESFDDLYLLARIINENDEVEAESFRRYRPMEGDEGEQKEVVVKIKVEKIEIDKNSERLRLTGTIVSGKPEQYISLGSHHTLNVAQGERIEITKPEWPGYIRDMLRDAVEESKKPRLGIVAIDEDKATIAYVRGYGIEISSEIYSKLSKKMKQQEYEKQRNNFFDEIIKKIRQMPVELVVIAGPGFTKDDLRQYLLVNKIDIGKKLTYAFASDTERSGIREALQSDEASRLMESDKIKKEFQFLDLFLRGLSLGASFTGLENIKQALDNYEIGLLLVNDSVLNDKKIKGLLEQAYRQHVEIKIFNSDDDAGMQLKNFNDIVAVKKSFAKGIA